MKDTLTGIGFNLNEEMSLKKLSVCLDALVESDKVLAPLHGRVGFPTEDTTRKKKIVPRV